MKKRREMNKMKIVSIIIYLLCSVGGLILVKSEANATTLAMQNGVFNVSMGIKAIIGFILYIGSFLIYTFYIIKQFDLSYIFPIVTGITQILVILASVFVLKESINIYGIIGIFTIIAGITLLNIK